MPMDLLANLQQSMGDALLGLLFRSTARTYWVFMLASCVVAMLLWRPERHLQLSPRERLWSKETWFSRSAMNDYGLIMINAMLLGVVFKIIQPDFKALSAFSRNGFELIVPHVPTAMHAMAPILLALTLFLVDDFLRFVIHYAEHRVPALWELHKVHHSATVLNFMTAERHHPIAGFYTGLTLFTGAALVNGLFLALYGSQITYTALLGGNLFWVAANFLGSSFRHSPVWISFGPRIERWIISPAQHQIHHSEDKRHFDKNMGSTLAIWDRLAGSLYVTGKERERITYGIGEETHTHISLAQIYAQPIKNLAQMVISPLRRRFAA